MHASIRNARVTILMLFDLRFRDYLGVKFGCSGELFLEEDADEAGGKKGRGGFGRVGGDGVFEGGISRRYFLVFKLVSLLLYIFCGTTLISFGNG